MASIKYQYRASTHPLAVVTDAMSIFSCSLWRKQGSGQGCRRGLGRGWTAFIFRAWPTLLRYIIPSCEHRTHTSRALFRSLSLLSNSNEWCLFQGYFTQNSMCKDPHPWIQNPLTLPSYHYVYHLFP